MVVIAITGKKGSGKSTLSSFLKEKLKSSGYNVYNYAFATPVKEICTIIEPSASMLMYSDPELKKEVVDCYGLTRRELMQNVGTLLKGISNDIWANLTTSEILKDYATRRNDSLDTAYIIDDLRYQNELDALVNMGIRLVTIRVVRPSLQSDDQHSSETEQDKLHTKHTITTDDKGVLETGGLAILLQNHLI